MESLDPCSNQPREPGASTPDEERSAASQHTPTGAITVGSRATSGHPQSDTTGVVKPTRHEGKTRRHSAVDQPKKNPRLGTREERGQKGSSAAYRPSIEDLRPKRAIIKKSLRAENASINKLIGTTPIPQMATYNIDLDAIPNTQHAVLVEYLRVLDRCSRPAVRDDTLKYELRRLWESSTGQVSKASMLRPLAEGVVAGLYSKRPDVQVVEEEAGLERAFTDGFSLPILIPSGSPLSVATVKCRELTKEVLSIEQFFSDVLQNDDKTIDIQDTGVEKGTPMARRVEVGKIKDRFSKPATRSSPWNGLEIGDTTRGVKWPNAIEKGNILNHLAYLPSASVGRPTMGKGEYKRLDPWYLWTEKDSISRQHEDVAGLRTIILVVEGKKIWYLQPQRLRSDQRRWEKQSDRGPDGYVDGWVRLVLQKNDILIMRPREVHAVFTPEDTLCVGGHFTLNISEVIRGLLVQEEHPELTNDEIPKHVFDTLSDYLSRVLDERPACRYTVDAAELNAVCVELAEYTERKPVMLDQRATEERAAHFKRRAKFVAKTKKEDWVNKLRVLAGGLG